jgi:hypothetical protein
MGATTNERPAMKNSYQESVNSLNRLCRREFFAKQARHSPPHKVALDLFDLEMASCGVPDDSDIVSLPYQEDESDPVGMGGI